MKPIKRFKTKTLNGFAPKALIGTLGHFYTIAVSMPYLDHYIWIHNKYGPIENIT